MSTQPPFTIRIRTEQDQDMDWMVQPEEITFRQALEVIAQVLPQATITAFEYDDEEGDRITVRSDDEMKEMFQMFKYIILKVVKVSFCRCYGQFIPLRQYFSLLSEEDMVRGLLPPLIIYPRVGKTPQSRNIHALKIKTDKQTTTSKSPKPVQLVKNVQSVVPSAVTIREALANMEFSDSDLLQEELLGKGNGGYVYRAVHKPTGTIMAVKEMKLDVEVEVQRQIISELEILSKCNSPVIIGFYKAFFIENRISICTEYMDGGSLDRYGQVPEPVLGRMAVYIIQGLCYMWNLKILHRDVKPSNILVSTAGQVKLCDFGVSVQLVKSLAKTYVGTNAYMAPERIRGEEYSTPAEVWSFGVSLFELASGMFPFGPPSSFSTPMQLFNRICDSDPQRLPADVFSPDFVDFVANCMQKFTSHRLNLAGLTSHPFIQRHNDGNTSVIANFVQTRLPLIKQNKAS